MERAEQVRLLKELLRHRGAGTNVDAGGIRRNPTSVYTCPDLARREREAFFLGTPQLIGLTGDLPGPGSFLTADDFGIPLLATRDEKGRFRAFLNGCRHRGARIESEPRGEKAHFSCPFHAWTYARDGTLVSVPKSGHFGAIDKSCHGLLELPAVEKYGFLWVHPDPEGVIDPDSLLGGLASEFESWDFGRLVHVGSDSYEMRLNWKLAMDTFGETYHFPTLHRNTLAQGFHGNCQAYDVFGRNHRMILCLRGVDDLPGRPEAEWHITDGGFPVYYLFPNVQLNVGSAGLSVVRAYPDPEDPARSVSRISHYFDEELVEAGSEIIAERFRVFGDVIRDEDYAVAETAQRSAESGLQEFVVFGRNEPALHHYHNTYREVLGMEPLELTET